MTAKIPGLTGEQISVRRPSRRYSGPAFCWASSQGRGWRACGGTCPWCIIQTRHHGDA
jgi:hypothetical protein